MLISTRLRKGRYKPVLSSAKEDKSGKDKANKIKSKDTYVRDEQLARKARVTKLKLIKGHLLGIW